MKQNKSRRFTANVNRKGKSVTADKVLAWKFLRWSRTIPIRVHSIVEPKSIVVRNVSLYFSRETIMFLFNSWNCLWSAGTL